MLIKYKIKLYKPDPVNLSFISKRGEIANSEQIPCMLITTKHLGTLRKRWTKLNGITQAIRNDIDDMLWEMKSEPLVQYPNQWQLTEYTPERWAELHRFMGIFHKYVERFIETYALHRKEALKGKDPEFTCLWFPKPAAIAEECEFTYTVRNRSAEQ